MDPVVFEDFGKCCINIGKLQRYRFSHLDTLFCVSLHFFFFLNLLFHHWFCILPALVTELGETQVGA